MSENAASGRASTGADNDTGGVGGFSPAGGASAPEPDLLAAARAGDTSSAGGASAPEPDLLAAARAGDSTAFDQLMAPYRPELTAHCYRMLGSPFDAEDAVQESLLSAWRGLAAFQGRSSVRTWLYRITTNACIRLGSQRSRRLLSPDFGPARKSGDDLGQPVPGPAWIEPWPDDAADPADPVIGPAESYLRRAAAHQAIAELKQGDEAEGDIVMWASRTLWTDLLAAGLVDELHLMVGAVVLGDGVAAFAGDKAPTLKLIDTRTWEGSDNVLLRYAVENS